MQGFLIDRAGRVAHLRAYWYRGTNRPQPIRELGWLGWTLCGVNYATKRSATPEGRPICIACQRVMVDLATAWSETD